MLSSALAPGTSNMLLMLLVQCCLGTAKAPLDATLLLSPGTFRRALASNTLVMLSKFSPGAVIDSTLLTFSSLISSSFQHDLDARALTCSYHVENLDATFLFTLYTLESSTLLMLRSELPLGTSNALDATL